MTTITAEQRHQLRSLAHHLKPYVLIGSQGLTEAVHLEIAQVLNDHELVKIRIPGEDRAQRKQAAAEIVERHQAALIQAVGHVIVIYRKQAER